MESSICGYLRCFCDYSTALCFVCRLTLVQYVLVRFMYVDANMTICFHNTIITDVHVAIYKNVYINIHYTNLLYKNNNII